MILVVFALPQEASFFSKWLAAESERFTEKIEVAIVGVGEAAVRRILPNILKKKRPRILLCGGFSGALSDEMSAETIFLATNRSTHPINFPRRGLSRQVPSVVSNAGSAVQSGVDEIHGVDMESEIILQVAQQHGIPLITLRVITDTPCELIPVPWAVCFDLATQKPRVFKTLVWLMCHPEKWKVFFKFLARLRRCAALLSDALVSVLIQLAEPQTPPLR